MKRNQFTEERVISMLKGRRPARFGQAAIFSSASKRHGRGSLHDLQNNIRYADITGTLRVCIISHAFVQILIILFSDCSSMVIIEKR